MNLKNASLLAAAATLMLGSATAQAASMNFTCITNNSASDCAIGEAQLSADLTGNTLTIMMTGANAAVVEQVFIEGAGVTGGTVANGGVGNVDFDDATAGGNLPGGNQPVVGFTEAVNFAANNPAPRKGIGYHSQDQVSGQYAVFTLQTPPSLLGVDLSDLRVGVHVIGFGSGGSESFVTGGGPKIPEPSAALVFGLGTIVVGTATRRKRR